MSFDLDLLINSKYQTILVLGNLPWVTNSQQGIINGNNLPKKTNFQAYQGLDAITGKSNFDISEWMLIKLIKKLQNHHAYLAILCKTSVARKILNYFHKQKYFLKYFATYRIDSHKYFDVSVDTCLLFCEIAQDFQQYSCYVFDSLESTNCQQIGYCQNILVNNLPLFKQLSYLYTKSSAQKWRSGIKHDCAKVMEFTKIEGKLINGFNQVVEIETNYIFPLLKGSAIANNRIYNTDKYILLTQSFIGESTEKIKFLAPKTWSYLQQYHHYLDNRKSKIYQNNPCFSIFGVGEYTFYPWKIAITGLYKKLEFRLINYLEGKPVIFDDTVYFLAFKDELTAKETFDLLTSKTARDFYSCLIFWDEKRPIKTSILNCLNLDKLKTNSL